LRQVATYNPEMDHYISERLVLDAHREMVRAAERRSRLTPQCPGVPFRVWVANRLRTIADKLDGRPQLRRVV